MLSSLFKQGYLEGFRQCYVDSRNIDKYVVWLHLMLTIKSTSQWINDNLDSSVMDQLSHPRAVWDFSGFLIY